MIKETLQAAEQLAAREHRGRGHRRRDAEAARQRHHPRIGRADRPLVIVHEAPLTCGFGAEIAARVAERGLTSLLAPIERVAGYDTMMPYPRIEAFYMPSVGRMLAAVRRAMAYT